MIITSGGIKGGSGKSTVATNLAVMRSLANSEVILVDADDQETASDFTIFRNEQLEDKGGAGYTSIKLNGAAVRTEVSRLKSKFEDIIIDTGGRDTTSQRAALVVSDILLVPFFPRSFDIWTINHVSKLVEEIRIVNPDIKSYVFLNRSDPRGQDNIEAVEALKESPGLEFLDVQLGQRKAFANASSKGLSIVELKPEDPKAINEMITLYQSVFNVEFTLG